MESGANNREHSGSISLPTKFGRYRIVRRLGAGAMGVVYLAHDTLLDRHVALKTPHFAKWDARLVERFYREARAAAKLHHRNICPIYDVGEIDGRPFISMGYIKGRTLSEYIHGERLPSPRSAALLVHRLATALAEAHRHNVVHRDLKPANIMINSKKEPIVMDFGLARLTDIDCRVTQSGVIVGTPAYMAPEQLIDTCGEPTATIDVYALGTIFYELLTGQLPFNGTIANVVYKIVHESPVPPSRVRLEVDGPLESICLKMMAKQPEQRYPSMTEVAAVLKAFLRDSSSSNIAPLPIEPNTVVRDTSSGSRATDSESQQSTETAPAPPPLLPTAVASPPSSLSLSPTRSRNRQKKRRVRLLSTIAALGIVTAVLIIGSEFHTKSGTVHVDVATETNDLVIRDMDDLVIRDKTLVAWVQLANLTQRGGSPLSIVTGRNPLTACFDAIVFGERAQGKWMAGSDYFRRTEADQSQYPSETLPPTHTVMIAIVYQGNSITIYRNRTVYASYTVQQASVFAPGHRVCMGLRALPRKEGRKRILKEAFAGVVEEARIYDRALDAKMIAGLEPNVVASPMPLAMWTFEDGTVTDAMGTYNKSRQHGAARIANGKLYLDGKTAYVECYRE